MTRKPTRTMTDTPTEPKNTKKSEMLEVRVSPDEKAAFLEACRSKGRSGSSVIRDAMRAYAQFGFMTRLPGSPLLIISSFLGAAAGAFALGQMQPETQPALSPEAMLAHPIFTAMDSRTDGVLVWSEFAEYFGSARDGLRLRDENGQLRPRSDQLRAARGVSALLGRHNWNISTFYNEPDTISEPCWTALEHAFQALLFSRFSEYDANADGYVTFREFAPVQLQAWQDNFDLEDLDGNGVITISDVMRNTDIDIGGTRPFIPPAEEPGYVMICRNDTGEHPNLGLLEEDREPMTESRAALWMTISDLDGDSEVSLHEWITKRLT